MLEQRTLSKIKKFANRAIKAGEKRTNYALKAGTVATMKICPNADSEIRDEITARGDASFYAHLETAIFGTEAA